MRLKFAGNERRLAPFLVAIANSKQYRVGAKIAPQAVVTDGFLTLSIVHPAPWYEHLWHLPKFFSGDIDRDPFVENILTKELQIAIEREEPYHIDGEIRPGGRNFRAKIEPRAIAVKVPQSYIP